MVNKICNWSEYWLFKERGIFSLIQGNSFTNTAKEKGKIISISDGQISGVVQTPAVTIPKDDGVIPCIGEEFAANLVTCTGSLAVSITTSACRSGICPQLSVTYGSGSSNGPYGNGWSLSLPHITRKTDKGIYGYYDREEFGLCILSEAEDLVPLLFKRDRNWVTGNLPLREKNDTQYRIKLYRAPIDEQPLK